MRVLLTGANGFVGSNILKFLDKNTDWDITTTDADLSKQYIQEERFDVIVNLASISSVQRSIEEPVEVIENNVMLTTKLLEYAREHRPQLFIQFSTIETNNVTNPYAASKKAQEAIAQAYSKTYSLPVVVIHSTNIIGKGQNPEKFVPKLIEQIKNDQPVTIYTHNGNQGYRYYNPVTNVAEAIKHLIEEPMKQLYDEVGLSGYRASNLEMAQTVAKALGKEQDVLYKFVEADTVRPGYLTDYDLEPEIDTFQFAEHKSLLEHIKEIVK